MISPRGWAALAILALLCFAVSKSHASDICVLPTVVQCTAMACMTCETKDDVKYCRMGGSCNTCTPDPNVYQCKRDDGSTYSKPLLETVPGIIAGGRAQ